MSSLVKEWQLILQKSKLSLSGPHLDVKQLRVFLALTGYYRKFIKYYGMISRSLIELLKNVHFQWIPVTEEAF